MCEPHASVYTVKIPLKVVHFARIQYHIRHSIACMDMQGALCFDDGYVGKQPMAWKEHCAECWLKEVHESMDRFTGRRDVTETEITSKTMLNTMQSIDQSLCKASVESE